MLASVGAAVVLGLGLAATVEEDARVTPCPD